MPQLQQAMARLRLLLAEIEAREKQLEGLIKQFQAQLDRLPRQVIYGRTTLETALSSMAEIEERLAYGEATRRHLLAIKRRAQQELEALELTQQVEEAKEALATLQDRVQAQDVRDEAMEEEMKRLEEFIAEYSKRAGRSITSAYQEGRA
jgi:chromosome segregation ATPase